METLILCMEDRSIVNHRYHATSVIVYSIIQPVLPIQQIVMVEQFILFIHSQYAVLIIVRLRTVHVRAHHCMEEECI